MTAINTNTILQYNLNRKREALEFFFNGDQPHLTALNKSTDNAISLTIELKPSHTYYSGDFVDSVNLTKNQSFLDGEILRYNNDGWWSFVKSFMTDFLKIFALLNCSDGEPEGETLDGRTTTNNNNLDNDDEQFIKDHSDLNTLPYTSRSNLMKMKKRLELDGGGNNYQLDKIKKLKSPSSDKATLSDHEDQFCSNLISLAKQQHQLSLMKIKLRESSASFSADLSSSSNALSLPLVINKSKAEKSFKTVKAVGHFNSMNLIGPVKYSNHVPANGQSDLLVYHPIIENYFSQQQQQQQTVRCRCNITILSTRKKNLMKLVNCLYAKVFNPNHPYDSFGVKLSKLLNKCDHDFILNFIYPIKREPYFELDPFLDSFDLPLKNQHDPLHQDDMIVIEKPQEQQQLLTIRQKLLIWRWYNNIARLIQLSERELVKSYSFQINIENFKLNQLKRMQKIQPERGYRLIEQIRLMAIEYIRKYELQLNEFIKLNSEKLESTENEITRAKDLLKEPKIKINLTGSVNLIRALVPKRTAKRPLMAKRRLKGSRASTRMSTLVHNMTSSASSLGHHDALTSEGAHLIDLESQVISNWRQFSHADNKATSDIDNTVVSLTRQPLPLQLVVTIQQATNVPMRSVYNYNHHYHVYQQQQFNRANSPFLSPSPTNSFNQLLQPQQQQQQQSSISGGNYYLVPPTTYVELIFQRNQQASSLSQGKNPSWNETLFFQINPSNPSSSSSSSSESQLTDEYLQLNLYDYNCYTIGQNDNNFQDLSSNNESKVTTNNRIYSSRQRIERHLLGSLRVPLTTLLSNGKIQGSFPLNQPMFLDNYQFQPEPTIIETAFQPEQQMIINNNNNRIVSRDPLQTYINLFITIDPPISMSMINQQVYFKTGSSEQDVMFDFARLWVDVLSQYNFYRHRLQLVSSSTSSSSETLVKRRHLHNTSARFINHKSRALKMKNFIINRHLRTLVLQRDAKYCLIVRLITPMKPPEDLISSKLEEQLDNNLESIIYTQMNALSRFVSLLSPLKYGMFNVRLLASNLWFSSVQLLNQCLGGYEEKAILLCNYFLYLGKCSAILLGDSLTEGRCVYVIVWHEQSRLFVEDQLAIQARDLDDELRGSPLQNEPLSSLPNQTGRTSKAVDQADFISRLPILIKSKSVQFWDPSNGKSYFSNQTQQPLYSVGSIVTCENVYANIQLTDNISDTNFDIRSKQFWYPLFDSAGGLSTNTTSHSLIKSALLMNKSSQQQRQQQVGEHKMSWRRQLNQLELMRKQIGRPLISSILSDDLLATINYEKFSPEQCLELKEAIEKNIKASLLRWRPNRPTYFNRTLSRLLAEKLASFETNILERQNAIDWKLELAELIRSEVLMVHLSSATNSFAAPYFTNIGAGYQQQQQQQPPQAPQLQIPSSRHIVSWPVNLPYTSMKTIVDSLFASGVHNADLELLDEASNNSTSGTQFLVACHVHPYPARVMSVWLYVAAILNINQSANFRATPTPQQ